VHQSGKKFLDRRERWLAGSRSCQREARRSRSDRGVARATSAGPRSPCPSSLLDDKLSALLTDNQERRSRWRSRQARSSSARTSIQRIPITTTCINLPIKLLRMLRLNAAGGPCPSRDRSRVGSRPAARRDHRRAAACKPSHQIDLRLIACKLRGRRPQIRSF